MELLSLRNNLQRACVLLAALTTATVLSFLVYRNLNIRFISDPRFSLERDGLLSFHRTIPHSPRLNLRLADSYLVDAAASEDAASLAADHAMLAATRSLWDHRAAYTLGTILELNGDIPRAEAALRDAVRLSPHHKRANWALGNLLLRQGRTEESIQFLRNAARLDSALYPVLFEQFNVSAGGDPVVADRLTANDPLARLSLVLYLVEKSEFDRATQLFQQVDPSVANRSEITFRILSGLVDAGRSYDARQLWAGNQPTPPARLQDLFWNGDFERYSSLDEPIHPELKSLFDWNFRPSPFTRIAIDTVSNGNGSQSLRLNFLGRDTTTLRDEIRQLVPLRQGSRYRIDFAFLTKDLQSPLGPRVAIASDTRIIAQSDPIPNGTSNTWRYLSVEFTAPSDKERKFLSIIRQPSFSYDDPTNGIVWFDDFQLTEISSSKDTSTEQ